MTTCHDTDRRLGSPMGVPLFETSCDPTGLLSQGATLHFRRRRRRRVLALFLPVLCFVFFVVQATSPPSLVAQTRRILFERISLDEGLSQSVVQTMHKDRKGFMWFGTESGLNRYDGYSFTVYKLNPFDSTTISSNNILSIAEDSSGALWIATNGGGINRFDREQNSFQRYVNIPQDPSSLGNNVAPLIFCDKKDIIWVFTIAGGVDRLDRSKGTFVHYRHVPGDKHSLSNNVVLSAFEDQAGGLWVGTADGLNRYDRTADRVIRYFHDPADPYTLGHDRIISLYEAPSEPGILWIGAIATAPSHGGGSLNRLDVASGIVTRYRHDPHDPTTLSSEFIGAMLDSKEGTLWIGTSEGLNRFDRESKNFKTFLIEPSNPRSPRNNIQSITEDATGWLWLTTAAGDGVYCFNPITFSFSHYSSNPSDPASLSNDVVLSVFADTTGVVWCGTQTGGISKVDLYATKFRTYTSEPGNSNTLSGNIVRSFLEDRQGFLWVGVARYGLNKFSRDRTRVTHYRYDERNPSSLSSDAVWSLCEDHHGTLWVGTLGGGLNRLDSKTGSFVRYLANPRDPKCLASNNIRVIFVDRSGSLWVGTDGGGLNKFDRQKEEFTRYLTIPGDTTSLSNNNVRAIAEGKDGVLWIGTFGGGVNRFDPAGGRFVRYQAPTGSPTGLTHNAVQSIFLDRDEVLWIGTFGGGLNRLDTRTGATRYYTEENSGLSNNVVYGVLGDDNGNIWVSSNRGISRLDQATGMFENYDISDGLQSKEYNGQACFKSRRGEFFFGGINGFNAFFPDSVHGNPYPPKMVITEFKLFDKEVPIGAGSPLRKHISETDSLEVAYWQNDFSFTFVALHFNRPQENIHQYMLENFDNGWRVAGTQRKATYTNLDPGEYVFRVKGANSDGVWSSTPAHIHITIHPPWWLTGWAKGLYALMTVALGFALYRMQHVRVTRKEREKARLREAELRAQAAEAQARAIEAEHRRQTHELEEARRIQLSLLPHAVPEVPTLDIAVYMQTATEVGGDYYDFSIDGDGSLTVVIGDATGHGLKAGTMVSVIKGLFVAQAPHARLPAFFEMCTRTVREFHLGNLYMALTLVRFKGFTLTASNAGMPPFYIYRKKTQSVEDVVLKGMPIGAFESFAYPEVTRTLEPGDTVLLLSDGLVELFDDQDEVFDYPRVREVFGRVGGNSPQEVIDGLVEAGEHWRNGRALHDDITFVVLRMKEAQPEKA